MHSIRGWTGSASTSPPAHPPRGFPQDDATGAPFGADYAARGHFQGPAPPQGYIGAPHGLSPPAGVDTLGYGMRTPMTYGGTAPVGGMSFAGSMASAGSFGPDEGRMGRGGHHADAGMRVAGLSTATSASGYHAKRMREMPSEGSSAGMAAMGSFGVPGGPGRIADTSMASAGEDASYEQQRRQRLVGVLSSALAGNRDSLAFGKWVFLPPHHVGVIPGVQAAVANEALVLSQEDLLGLVSSAMRGQGSQAGGVPHFGAEASARRDAPRAPPGPIVADGSIESLPAHDYGYAYGPRPRPAAGQRPSPLGESQRHVMGPHGHGIAAAAAASRPMPGGSSQPRRRTTPPSMHRPLPGAADPTRKRDREAGASSSSSSSSSSSAAGVEGLPPRPESGSFGGAGHGLHILKHAADSLGSSAGPRGTATIATAASSTSPDVGPLSGPPPLSPADSEGRALPSVDSSGRVTSRMRRSLVHDARVAEGTRTGTVSSKDGVSWGRVNNPISFVEHSDLPESWPSVPFPRDYLVTNLPPDDARAGRLTRAAVQGLRGWMTQGRTWLSPYPTPSNIASLSERTGMSPKQLRDWFRNERKRVWLPFWQSRLSDPSCAWAVQRSSGGRANIIPKDVLERFAHYSSDLDLNTAITLDLEAAGVPRPGPAGMPSGAPAGMLTGGHAGMPPGGHAAAAALGGSPGSTFR